MALELPDDLRDRIGSRMNAAEGRLPRARWVDPRLLHLTLVFLGGISSEAAETLGVALAGSFRGHRSFVLSLGEPGTFPPRGAARVAWIGVEGGDDLLRLHADVAACVEDHLGSEPERRPFHPHVTVARCRAPWKRYAVERYREEMAGIEARFPVGEGVLMVSQLGPGGPSYSVRTRLPLAQG